MICCNGFELTAVAATLLSGAKSGVPGTAVPGRFATGQYAASGPLGPSSTGAVTGLFYGGGAKQLEAQFIGSFCMCAATFVVAWLMFKAINAVGLLRVSREGELEGLDLHEHGTVAYHMEFGYGSTYTPPPSDGGSSGGVPAPGKEPTPA